MTREEKINTLKAIIQECEDCQWQRKETLFEIIKDLEQEPILDKIRAEIKKSSHGKWYAGRLDGKTEEVLLLDEVLQIIDKHISGK